MQFMFIDYYLSLPFDGMPKLFNLLPGIDKNFPFPFPLPVLLKLFADEWVLLRG